MLGLCLAWSEEFGGLRVALLLFDDYGRVMGG
jgi:hypothetical protein